MASDKTKVIQYLFEKFWDEQSLSLTKHVMTLDDVKDAIRACNALDNLNRSDRNPANFLKDIVRSKNAAKNWPPSVAALGYTGEQRTGGGDSFAFVRLTEGQADIFPDLFRPDEKTERVPLQSVSLPQYAKDLGRTDEAWLIQTAVNLRVIEHHLATKSDLNVQEIIHLQMNVKLRATEIDAVYWASVLHSGALAKAIITCEAKQHKERILVGQITSQVQAAFETTDAELVIPTAIRSVRTEGIQVIEFEAVHRRDLPSLEVVSFKNDVVYKLVPPVKGI